MSRYFFNLYNDIEALDPEGREFANDGEARANAISEAREMMMESVSEGRINFSHRIDIANEAGDVLGTVTFGEAVLVEG